MAEEVATKEGGKVSPEMKNLQRELQKARDKNTELVKQLLSQGEVQMAINRIEEQNLVILSRESGDLDGADDEEDSVVSKAKAARTRDVGILTSRRQAAELIEDADTDWSDPRLEEARRVWDSAQSPDDFAKAAKLTKDALGGADPDFTTAVRAEFQRLLREEKGVDTGDNAGPTGGELPRNAEERTALLLSKGEAGRNARRQRLDELRRGG